jgi:hypothetical protein
MYTDRPLQLYAFWGVYTVSQFIINKTIDPVDKEQSSNYLQTHEMQFNPTSIHTLCMYVQCWNASIISNYWSSASTVDVHTAVIGGLK